MSQNAALIENYAKSLLMQYVSKPNAFATIESFVTSLMIYDLSIAVRDGYDPATAVGIQQDILGKYLGVLRVIKGFALQVNTFGYLDYTQTPPVSGRLPYLDYAAVPSGHFLNYDDGQSTYTLTDDEFRTVLAMSIQRQHSNGSMDAIHATLFPVFGNNYLAVETQCQIHYFVQSEYDRIANLLNALGYFPKPMGMKMSLESKPVLSS